MSKFNLGDKAKLINSPLPNSPNIGRTVLIVGYSNHQPGDELWFQIVGFANPLEGACGFPVNAPESHLEEFEEGEQ